MASCPPQSARRRIVVTGMGAVSAYGLGAPALIEGTLSGQVTLARIRNIDTSAMPVSLASEVTAPLSAPAQVPAHRSSLMAWHAARDALFHAGLDPDRPPESTSLAAAVGWAPAPTSLTETNGWSDRMLDAWRGQPDFQFSFPGTTESALHRALGLKGRLVADHAACAAGLHAMVHAARSIRSGRSDLWLAGASDSRCHPLGILGYARMGVLYSGNMLDSESIRGASRPFDQNRSGFVIGEGAGFLVLESLEHAEHRGAKPLAELASWSLTHDAEHPTEPSQDGIAAAECIRLALQRAGLDPCQVDYLNAHGTSTVANDVMECRAFAEVFGRHRENAPWISSTKSMIGHLAMAAGAVESIATLGAMQRRQCPPSVNLETPDPEGEGLRFAPNRAQDHDMSICVKTAFGLGGQNACVVWKKLG
ncbi:MAG: beta-ketoacyl-[acyl-carrier-protein] synthase family protein [Candidatus Methylacidiphilales bacterium]